MIPPDQALGKIAPLTAALYEMFPLGARQALLYFQTRGLEINRPLIVCMIRYEVKQLLLSADFEVEDDDLYGVLSVEHLANNGLACAYNGISVKILKSDDGRLPVPGQSKRLQAYYAQAQQLEFRGEGFEERTTIDLNVVVLWRFDPSYNVIELRLAAPKSGNYTRASVQEYWNVAIEHPAVGHRFEPPIQGVDVTMEPEIIKKEEEPVRERTKNNDLR